MRSVSMDKRYSLSDEDIELLADSAAATVNRWEILIGSADESLNSTVKDIFSEDERVYIDIAENGQEAFDKYRNGGIDLILMDMEMPIMDGFEATRRIRKLETERGATPVPIVALTAHAFSEERQRCLNAGCSHFFTKPIRKAALLKLLQDIFNPSGSSG